MKPTRKQLKRTLKRIEKIDSFILKLEEEGHPLALKLLEKKLEIEQKLEQK